MIFYLGAWWATKRRCHLAIARNAVRLHHHHHHGWRYLHCYMQQGHHFALISNAGLKWVQVYNGSTLFKITTGLTNRTNVKERWYRFSPLCSWWPPRASRDTLLYPSRDAIPVASFIIMENLPIALPGSQGQKTLALVAAGAGWLKTDNAELPILVTV